MNFLNRFKKLKKPLIIAEIGNNHEGSFNNALRLIDAAKKSGVDAVKFQTYKPELYYPPSEEKRIKKLTKYQLSYDQFSKLSLYARKNKLIFISTPFDMDSLSFLKKIVDIIKISSGDNNFQELITGAIKSNKELIISTGLTSLIEIKDLKKVIEKKNYSKNTYFLHCVANYPVKPENANLNFILKLKNLFKDNIGYSDHTLGIDSCIIAFLLGSTVIEKHFTLDKSFSSFRDHAISADPKDMSLLVKKIKEYRILLDDKKNDYLRCENKERILLRRSLYINKDFEKNKKIREEDIVALRPAKGIPPNKKFLIINKKSAKNLKKGTLINLKNLIINKKK